MECDEINFCYKILEDGKISRWFELFSLRYLIIIYAKICNPRNINVDDCSNHLYFHYCTVCYFRM